jgi:hypothetical protein
MQKDAFNTLNLSFFSTEKEKNLARAGANAIKLLKSVIYECPQPSLILAKKVKAYPSKEIPLG